MLGRAVMGCEGIGSGKAFTAAVAFKIHLGPGALRAFTQAGCSVSS